MLNHDKRSNELTHEYDDDGTLTTLSSRQWDPSMLVVVPMGALLERNVLPTQFGDDIWKPTPVCDSAKRYDQPIYLFPDPYRTLAINKALSDDLCASNTQTRMIPRTNNTGRTKGDCGCRCPHNTGSHSRDNTPKTKRRPILVLNDILESSGALEPMPRSSASTSVASSATKQYDGSERKQINLFASLKLGDNELDGDDDQSDADSLLSSISKEISKFDGERRAERGQTLSPSGPLISSSKIYSQGVVVSCSPLALSEDRYSTHSGDDSPWNLPN